MRLARTVFAPDASLSDVFQRDIIQGYTRPYLSRLSQAPSTHMHIFSETQKQWMRTDIPAFRAGDTLRVNVRVKEGEKERVQAFEGVCIARRGSGVSETFTVRKISNGIGVERI